ncbi:unnamed protein product, partial [marine sediment metagenome]
PPGIAEDYYEFKINDPNAFFLRAQGNCMSPEIKNGDLLLIYPNEKVENGDIAVIVNNKGQKEVRRVTFQADEITLTVEDDVKIIGRVKEISKKEVRKK